MIVFAVAGMPGAGKSTFIEKGVELGCYSIRMGDLVIEEVERRGLPITDQNVGRIAQEMRVNYGKISGNDGFGYWAVKTVERIKRDCKNEFVLIDGTRGDREIKVFREEFSCFRVVGIYSPEGSRVERILNRGRKDDISSLEELRERDRRELSWGLGNVVALADIMLINDGSLERFKEKIDDFYTSQGK